MNTKKPRFVAYYRVSTERQGASGLGLDAQKDAVRRYGNGDGNRIIGEYTEIESGTKDDRPELTRAIGHALRSRCPLLIAKWDRLSRNAGFISRLMDSNVRFMAVDNVNACPMYVRILSAVAQDEVERIRERTKSALAAAKRRGVKLGSARPGHWDDPARCKARLEGLARGRARALVVNREATDLAYADLYDEAVANRGAGWTLQRIADRLNDAGQNVKGGGSWSPVAVSRLLKRAAARPAVQPEHKD